MYQIQKQNFRSLLTLNCRRKPLLLPTKSKNARIRFNHTQKGSMYHTSLLKKVNLSSKKVYLNLIFSSKTLINITTSFSGLQLNVSDVWKLFAAIAIHAVAILFSIGAEMVYSGTKRLQVTFFNYRSFKCSFMKFFF